MADEPLDLDDIAALPVRPWTTDHVTGVDGVRISPALRDRLVAELASEREKTAKWADVYAHADADREHYLAKFTVEREKTEQLRAEIENLRASVALPEPSQPTAARIEKAKIAAWHHFDGVDGPWTSRAFMEAIDVFRAECAAGSVEEDDKQ